MKKRKASHGFSRISTDIVFDQIMVFICANPRKSVASSLVCGRFECSGASSHRPEKCRALCFKRFELRSHDLLLPPKNGADAQGGFATARFGPAGAQRHRHAS